MKELLLNVEAVKLYKDIQPPFHYYVEFTLKNSLIYFHDEDYDKLIEKANKYIWSILD